MREKERKKYIKHSVSSHLLSIDALRVNGLLKGR